MTSELPQIPTKRYFTIGEVSELCGVKPHVLRYWEQEFTQLKPIKRRGNRRYYQHHEVLLIRRIRNLLYDQGFTISGARQQLLGGFASVEKKAFDNADFVDNSLQSETFADSDAEITVTISDEEILPIPDLSEDLQSNKNSDLSSIHLPEILSHSQHALSDFQKEPASLASSIKTGTAPIITTWSRLREELLAIRKILEED